jgi:hypothetical protein
MSDMMTYANYQEEDLPEANWDPWGPVDRIEGWDRGVDPPDDGFWVKAPMTDWPGGRHSWTGNTPLTFWGIRERHVQSVRGTVYSLWCQNPRLFHSRDHGYLKKLFSCEVQKVHVEEKVAKVEEVCVFFFANGPAIHDVQASEGDGSSVDYAIDTIDKKILVCKRAKAGGSRVEVHPTVIHSWMQKAYSFPAKDFLSLKFYEQSMRPYAVWSYERHVSQLKLAFENVPTDVKVIAPGDGIGIARMALDADWGDNIRSSDAVIDAWSHPSVKKSTFFDSLVPEEGAVLLLSYVNSLLRPRERDIVDFWPGPVFWIDSTAPMYLDVVQFSPNVWGRRVPKKWRPSCSIVKDTLPVKFDMPYSENLMSLPGVLSLTDNAAVQYYRAMSPLRVQPGGVLVLYDMKEWRLFLDSHHRSAYLAIIGKEVLREGQEVHRHNLIVLPEKHVYFLKVTQTPTILERIIKESFSYCEESDRLWFVTRVNSVIDGFKVRMSDGFFDEAVYHTKAGIAQLVTCGPEARILVSTPRGLKRWKSDGGFLDRLLEEFVRVHGEFSNLRQLLGSPFFSSVSVLSIQSKLCNGIFTDEMCAKLERSWDGDPFHMMVDGVTLAFIFSRALNAPESSMDMESDRFFSRPCYAVSPSVTLEANMIRLVDSFPREFSFSQLVSLVKRCGESINYVMVAVDEKYYRTSYDRWRKKPG